MKRNVSNYTRRLIHQLIPLNKTVARNCLVYNLRIKSHSKQITKLFNF